MNSASVSMIALLLFLPGLVTTSLAKEPVAVVNAKNSLALKGYDAVAYFSESRAVKGSPEFTFEWKGAKWLFASKANRDAFEASPEKYAPQFGGYCAWAVGHGYTADADPQAWKIVDGKLYVNYNKSVQEKWQQEQQKWIEAADKNWPALHK